MWLSLIILGALHGLVLLPVLRERCVPQLRVLATLYPTADLFPIVSLFGGAGYSIDDEDEEWMSSAIRRHDYEYTWV